MTTSQVDNDRILLKRCLDGDAEAIVDFDDLGYTRTVRRAVTEVVGSRLSAESLEDLVNSCVGKVYEAWNTLPSQHRDLRELMRSYVITITKKFLNERQRQQLAKKKT